MRILHLTDLHIRKDLGPKLDALWLGVQRVLDDERAAGNRLDFIVLSGDIADHAQEDEYGVARHFVDRLTLLVEGPDCIIIVPGNHDVTWNTSLGTPLVVPPRELARCKLDFITRREQSPYRFKVTPLGAMSRGIEREPSAYARRFAHFQRFIDDYYGGHRPNLRRFSLLRDDDQGHWSAHVFPAQGISFYGVNTCSLTDEYATGVCLSAEALASLSRHLKENTTPLKIAVAAHAG